MKRHVPNIAEVEVVELVRFCSTLHLGLEVLRGHKSDVGAPSY